MKFLLAIIILNVFCLAPVHALAESPSLGAYAKKATAPVSVSELRASRVDKSLNTDASRLNSTSNVSSCDQSKGRFLLGSDGQLSRVSCAEMIKVKTGVSVFGGLGGQL